MKIKTLMSEIKPESFIENYFMAYGIENANEYINPTPNVIQDIMLYKNMDKVCETIYQAIRLNHKIGILVDEDVDGLCSSSMLYLFLTSLKADVVPYFQVYSKTHGISANSETKNQIQNIDLLIIPDASIDKFSAQQFKEKGIEVIELDHHSTEEKEDVMGVNCNWQTNTNHHACGTLVTYKVIQGLCEMFSIPYPNYNDFIALATVADVMDMTELENRFYTKEFYDTFTDAPYNPFILALNERFNRDMPPTVNSIGWKIAPPINAVFRCGTRDDVKDMFYAIIGERNNREIINEISKIKRKQ